MKKILNNNTLKLVAIMAMVLDHIAYAFIEANGVLSIIRKDNIIVKNPDIVIMDGKINYDYLKKYQVSEQYILNKINEKGYKNINEIFFAQELIDDFYIIPFDEFN